MIYKLLEKLIGSCREVFWEIRYLENILKIQGNALRGIEFS